MFTSTVRFVFESLLVILSGGIFWKGHSFSSLPLTGAWKDPPISLQMFPTDLASEENT